MQFPRAGQDRGTGAESATGRGWQEWEVIAAGGVRDEHAWDSLHFLTSIPSSSSQLCCRNQAPESSDPQGATAVAGTSSECIGAHGLWTASHPPHSTNSPPETSCPPTAVQIEGTHASYPLSPPSWQIHLLPTCTKRMELLHPSSSHCAAPNLELRGPTHPSITKLDCRVTLK